MLQGETWAHRLTSLESAGFSFVLLVSNGWCNILEQVRTEPPEDWLGSAVGYSSEFWKHLPAHEVTNLGLSDRAKNEKGCPWVQSALSSYERQARIQGRIIYPKSR